MNHLLHWTLFLVAPSLICIHWWTAVHLFAFLLAGLAPVCHQGHRLWTMTIRRLCLLFLLNFHFPRSSIVDQYCKVPSCFIFLSFHSHFPMFFFPFHFLISLILDNDNIRLSSLFEYLPKIFWTHLLIFCCSSESCTHSISQLVVACLLRKALPPWCPNLNYRQLFPLFPACWHTVKESYIQSASDINWNWKQCQTVGKQREKPIQKAHSNF